MTTVFISYSHDSDQHADRVLDLAERLAQEGLEVILDQWVQSPPEGWPRWMDGQIAAADYVLLVCTETYFRRVMGRETPGKGQGVRWEGNLIYQYIYNADTTNTRFIPVLLEGGRPADIPTPLQGATYYFVDTPRGYEDLYRRLTNQPYATRPPIGQVHPMPPRQHRGDHPKSAEPPQGHGGDRPKSAESAERGADRPKAFDPFYAAGRPADKPASPRQLRLDAAAPDQVVLGRAFDVAVAVRRPASPLLAEEDLTHIHSGDVQVEWPQSQSYIRLRVQISAPECDLSGPDSYSFRLYPDTDSPVFYFHLVAKQLGEVSLSVQLWQEEDGLGSTRIKTTVRERVVGSVQVSTSSQSTTTRPADGGQSRQPKPMTPIELRDFLVAHMSESEVRDLCQFGLEIDYEDLGGETKSGKIRELIGYCQRRARLEELQAACWKMYSKLPWPK